MTKPKPKLTKAALHEAIKPPNNCQVKRFRESLRDDEEINAFDEAIGYDKRVLAAPELRKLLLEVGYEEALVPSADHISAHRNTVAPCRCKS